jgi:ABC-type molybdate transport system permease subunit
LQKSNAKRSKVSWRPNRTPRRTGLADSTFVSQSRRAAGLLVLVLAPLVLAPLVLAPLVLGPLILVLAELKLGPEVPGLGLGVTWGVTLVAAVG